jgi:DNA (cytosine-5)-methyltransferase 1
VRYISLFSGVEAATLAWEPLGWEAVAFAEIEPFPSAVLAHRWPDVPNLGDVTKVDWSKYRGTVDLVVGGSPCQAFSVAGKREGLLDERGQLMLEYVRAVREVEPRWFLWENVPGVLSQDKGRAFGTLLGEMADLGYSCAFRVLDAQFFGVAQRRRRVFLVGCLGGGQERLQRYSLSPKACQGILRRASKRGKPLPPMLEAALRAQGGV